MNNQSLRYRLAKSVAQIAYRFSGAQKSTTSAVGGYNGIPSRSDRLRAWDAGSGSAASETLRDLPDLRSSSSDLIRNTPLASGALLTNVSGVIGTGLQYRPALPRKLLGLSREEAQEKSAQIRREFALACKTMSWGGNLPWYDQQELILRSALEKGDVGIARRYDKRPGEVYGLKLVLIEAERISNPQGKSDSERIKGGVQFSSSGVVEGYHFTKYHPGDVESVKDRKWEYVPAIGKNGLPLMLLPIAHLRPGQPRGVPYLAPIIELVKQLSDYTSSEVNAAVKAAALFAFIEREANAEETGGANPFEAGSSNITKGDDEIELKDGLIVDLGPGESVNIPQNGRPNSEFEPFVTAVLRQIGVALEIPFELLVKHFTSSYSASRAALEMAWQAFRKRRGWLARHALDPIFEWFMVEAVSSGRIEAPGFFDDPVIREAWLTGEWIGPPRMSIDPLKEARADEVDIKTGAKTRQQAMLERTGGEFDEKHDQLAHENDRRVADGLTPSVDAEPEQSDPDDEEEEDEE